MDQGKILLIGEASGSKGSLRAQLESLGFPLEVTHDPEEARQMVEADRFSLVVIDATSAEIDGFRIAKHIKGLTREKAVPVMFACHSRDLRTEVESRDMGADDCFARPIDTQELGARIRLLLRNRDLELSLRERHLICNMLNRDLVRAREVLDRELDLASRIQRSMLPAALPVVPNYQFAAALSASGTVSGDFYDIYRLDEKHYGFYIADAVGHGVPAALLTIFVKKGLETRDLTPGEPGGYRLLSPGEVLQRLNHDMIEQKLSTNPFITLFYAILDVETGLLRYASGGHPPAVVLEPGGATIPLLSDGALLGIMESEFTTGEHTLQPGDTVVLYTDGIEQAYSPSGRSGLDAVIEYMRQDPPAASGPGDKREPLTRQLDASLEALLPAKHHLVRTDDATLFVFRRIA